MCQAEYERVVEAEGAFELAIAATEAAVQPAVSAGSAVVEAEIRLKYAKDLLSFSSVTQAEAELQRAQEASARAGANLVRRYQFQNQMMDLLGKARRALAACEERARKLCEGKIRKKAEQNFEAEKALTQAAATQAAADVDFIGKSVESGLDVSPEDYCLWAIELMKHAVTEMNAARDLASSNPALSMEWFARAQAAMRQAFQVMAMAGPGCPPKPLGMFGKEPNIVEDLQQQYEGAYAVYHAIMSSGATDPFIEAYVNSFGPPVKTPSPPPEKTPPPKDGPCREPGDTCIGLLLRAQWLQALADAAQRALDTAQSDLNEAAALEKQAAVWQATYDKRIADGRSYDKQGKDAFDKADAATDPAGKAGWTKIGNGDIAQRDSIQKDADYDLAQANALRAQAKALRDKVRDEQDEANWKAREAADAWQEYNDCMARPPCPPKGSLTTGGNQGSTAIGGGAQPKKTDASGGGGGNPTSNPPPNLPPPPPITPPTFALGPRFKLVRPPKVPDCGEPSECEPLHQYALLAQANADAAARELPNADAAIRAADEEERMAEKYHAEALKAQTSAKKAADSGQAQAAADATASAQQLDGWADAAERAATTLREKAAAIRADAANWEGEATAAWTDYGICLRRPKCPKESINPSDDYTYPPGDDPDPPESSSSSSIGSGAGAAESAANCFGIDPGCLNLFQGSPLQSWILSLIDQFDQDFMSDKPASPKDAEPPPAPEGEKHVRLGSAHLQNAAWRPRDDAEEELDPGTKVELVPPPAAAKEPRTKVEVALIANGRSTGEALEARVYDSSGKARRMMLPAGTVLVPMKQSVQAPESVRGSAGVLSDKLNAFCLNFGKLPPKPGTLYRVAPKELQEKYRPMRYVLKAGRELASNGLLHPDSNPAAYADAIRQYAVWIKQENWNEAEFTKQFIERTKKNAEQMKMAWTKQMENTLVAAAPGRWRDITQVLQRAQALEKASAERAEARKRFSMANGR